MLHRHPLLSLATGAYLLFVAWLTLTPQPISPDQMDLVQRVLEALQRRGYVESLSINEVEFLANIALFVPVGMFLLLFFTPAGWWVAVLGSAGITVMIELAQRGIPGRVSDERDLVANTLGGVIGVLVALVLTLPATLRRRREREQQAAYASSR